MRPHTKPVLLEHLTQSPYSHFVTTSNKHNFLIAVLSVDGDYAFCGRNEREAKRLIKPCASDV
jgi:hypothetical protein